MKDFEFEAQPDDEGGGDPDCSTMHTEMMLDEGSVNNFSKTLNKMPFDGRRKVRESPLCVPPWAARPQPPPPPPLATLSTLASQYSIVVSPGRPSIAGLSSLRPAQQVWHVLRPE